MASNTDPRTVSRDIAGVFEAILPRLLPGIVAHLNRSRITNLPGLKDVPEELIRASQLQKAMLFEIAVAAGEQLLPSTTASVDWDRCLATAASRQRRYYDAAVPTSIGEQDRHIAQVIGTNLRTTLGYLSGKFGAQIELEPIVPGFHWIATGCGDYSCGPALIEVKCSGRLFGAADYRQLILYWLLSYIAGRERLGSPWKTGILVNPRLNVIVEMQFAETIPLLSAGLGASEVAQLLESMIERYTNQ